MLQTIPVATRCILIANVAVYILQKLFEPAMTALFALWPIGPDFAPWQVLTYAFLHDPNNLFHILLNMYAVWLFGSKLEQVFGPRRYLTLYFVSLLTAAATQLAVTHINGGDEPTLGASGAVFGILLAFAAYFPRVKLMLLFPPIPMPAWLFVALYGAIELVLGVTQSQSSVAHFAHLGGLAGGALVILWWRRNGARFGPRL